MADEFCIPVAILQQMISPRDFQELLIWRSKKPHWSFRLEQYLILIAYIIGESNRDPKGKPTPYKKKDFILPFGGEKKLKPKQVEAQIASAFAGLGIMPMGDYKRGKHRKAGGKSHSKRDTV